MSKTAFLFGIHMHQPVDNFGWVVEKAIKECYLPFFETVAKYPEFHFSVHCSGWLLEQIEEHSPKLFKIMKTLTQYGSIEWFGAGYYEPVLSSIASADRRGQIDMLNRHIEEKFGHKPSGSWLTERVWESSIVPDLVQSGIRYTVIDDYHFQCAGFDESKLDGMYVTEEGGTQLGLFPISKKLRYAIPFKKVPVAIDAIKSFAKESDSAAILFDDAEKFGMWPGTYAWVYEKGWLKNFIEGVLAEEAIVPMTFSEYFSSVRPRGIAYLPSASYYEMGEWSLDAEDTLKLEHLKHEMGLERYEHEGVKFLKGGIWKTSSSNIPKATVCING